MANFFVSSFLRNTTVLAPSITTIPRRTMTRIIPYPMPEAHWDPIPKISPSPPTPEPRALPSAPTTMALTALARENSRKKSSIYLPRRASSAS